MQDYSALLLIAFAFIGVVLFLFNQFGPNRYYRHHRHYSHDPYDPYDPYISPPYPRHHYDSHRYEQPESAYHQRERWFRSQVNARQIMDTAIFLIVVLGMGYWIFFAPQ